jgi:hypothetical protein
MRFPAYTSEKKNYGNKKKNIKTCHTADNLSHDYLQKSSLNILANNLMDRDVSENSQQNVFLSGKSIET